MSKKRTPTVDKGEAIRLAGEFISLPIAAMNAGMKDDSLATLIDLERKAIAEAVLGGFPYALMLAFVSAFVVLKSANVDAEISVIIRERTT